MPCRLCGVAEAVYRSTPRLVSKYVVPAAFALAGDQKSDIKAACSALLAVLAGLMGQQLAEAASSYSPAIRLRVAEALKTAAAE